MADDPALYCFKCEEVDAIQWAIEKLMTAKILPFPERPTEAQGWICGCGGFNWMLYANGDCLCLECNHINTVIKVVRQYPTDGSKP